jgi:hypothetical protein
MKLAVLREKRRKKSPFDADHQSASNRTTALGSYHAQIKADFRCKTLNDIVRLAIGAGDLT